MKHVLTCFLIALLPFVAFAEDVPLGTTVRIQDVFLVGADRQMTAADSGGGPWCDVTKNNSSAPIVIAGGLMTPMSGLTTTGGYMFLPALTTTNGFAITDNVVVDCFAKVGGITQPVAKAAYRIVAAENHAGFPVVDTTYLTGTLQTARDIGASVLLSSGTGTGQVKISSGYLSPNFSDILGTLDAPEIGSAAFTAPKFGTGALDANALATDFANEIRDAVWAAASRILTAATNITSTGGTVTISGGAVTVGTNNDKTGYSLSGTQTFNNTGTWTGALTGTTGGMTAAGWAGAFTVNTTKTYSDCVAGSLCKEVADNAGGSLLTNGSIAAAVWGYTIAICAGTSGTTCQALNNASSAGNPWDEALPGAHAIGSSGYIVGNQLLRTMTNNRPALVNATGGIAIDYANVQNPTTTLNLSGTTIKDATDVQTDTNAIIALLPTSLDGGMMRAKVESMAADTLTSSALATDAVNEFWAHTFSELAQATPSSAPSAADAIMAPYMALRNKVTVTATQKSFTNDAGVTIYKKTLADVGGTFTESEAVSGP